MKKILDILFKKKQKGVTREIRIIENGREKKRIRKRKI